MSGTEKHMKLGSLFDGSGGFPLAARMCGIEPVWASEIEAYPIRVTKKNFPHMKHLGDIREICGGKVEPVDVITFGSPCQDLSISGRRAGLAGERSGLFMEAIRIIREMQEATNGKYPTYIVWENVPGAFSSNKGEDFRRVVEEIARIKEKDAVVPRPAKGKWQPAGTVLGDGYSLAWRVLDAQYWGVPQHRKRIFLVADFRGGRAGEILFKRTGLRGNIAQGTAARKGIAATSESGAHAAGFMGKAGAKSGSVGYARECAPTLRAGMESHVLCCYPKTAGTLCASGEGTERPAGQANETDFCVCIAGNTIGRQRQNGGDGTGTQRDTAYTLTVADRHAVFGFKGYGDYRETETAKSIMAQDDITTGDLITGIDCRNGREMGNICGILQAKENGGYSLNTTYSVRVGGLVRRLTPLECCRLQGFPDWWCDGVAGSDSAQYRMWGNGVALPCVLYVMEGIATCWKE